MKIYLLIKPWDYTSAEVEVFKNQKAAEDALKSGGKNTYWTIQEVLLP